MLTCKLSGFAILGGTILDLPLVSRQTLVAPKLWVIAIFRVCKNYLIFKNFELLFKYSLLRKKLMALLNVIIFQIFVMNSLFLNNYFRSKVNLFNQIKFVAYENSGLKLNSVWMCPCFKFLVSQRILAQLQNFCKQSTYWIASFTQNWDFISC